MARRHRGTQQFTSALAGARGRQNIAHCKKARIAGMRAIARVLVAAPSSPGRSFQPALSLHRHSGRPLFSYAALCLARLLSFFLFSVHAFFRASAAVSAAFLFHLFLLYSFLPLLPVFIRALVPFRDDDPRLPGV